MSRALTFILAGIACAALAIGCLAFGSLIRITSKPLVGSRPDPGETIYIYPDDADLTRLREQERALGYLAQLVVAEGVTKSGRQLVAADRLLFQAEVYRVAAKYAPWMEEVASMTADTSDCYQTVWYEPDFASPWSFISITAIPQTYCIEDGFSLQSESH